MSYVRMYLGKSLTNIAYLFTFCPPGPEERLNEISQFALLRMVSASRLDSHFLAAASSASSGSPPARLLESRAARHLVRIELLLRLRKWDREAT